MWGLRGWTRGRLGDGDYRGFRMTPLPYASSSLLLRRVTATYFPWFSEGKQPTSSAEAKRRRRASGRRCSRVSHAAYGARGSAARIARDSGEAMAGSRMIVGQSEIEMIICSVCGMRADAIAAVTAHDMSIGSVIGSYALHRARRGRVRRARRGDETSRRDDIHTCTVTCKLCATTHCMAWRRYVLAQSGGGGPGHVNLFS